MTGRGLAIAAVTLAVACGLLTVAPVGTAQPVPSDTTVFTVDLGVPLEPINRHLVGFGWHDGGPPLSTVGPLDPHLIRIDARLEEISVGPGEPLRLDELLARIAAIRGIGAEPLVILSYMPAWLGQPGALGRDPTRVAPADLDAWQRLVHDVIHALATAPLPARRFEAWNEPDVPLFWQDTPLAWVDTVERTARAVSSVERETGLDLTFGGPATSVPDPAYLQPFLLRFRDPTLPLDFVSWHYYGNYPFFGPDGAEFPLTEPIQPILGRPNPLTSPGIFGPQVPFVRALTDAALVGSGRTPPDLVLDEWNLSAAGFDRRHDTAAGAAFSAGVLIELQDAGLDASAYFRANDTRGVPGEHGLVTIDGANKPAWWTFELWQRLADTRVSMQPGRSVTDDLWAVAAADEHHVTVLLVAFRADDLERPPARHIELRLVGDPPFAGATIRRIDNDHPQADSATPAGVSEGAVRFDLPDPGVVLIELTLEPTDGEGSSATAPLLTADLAEPPAAGHAAAGRLAATGGDRGWLAPALLVALGLALRGMARWRNPGVE